MIVEDDLNKIFREIDAKDFEVYIYRRSAPNRGWEVNLSKSGPQDSGSRNVLSVTGKGISFSLALGDAFNRLVSLVRTLEWMPEEPPAYNPNASDDDIPF